MCSAFGKSKGTMARAHISQVIMSIYAKLQNKKHEIEALFKAKFKFPGRQKWGISKKWGFTYFNVDEFESMCQKSGLSWKTVGSSMSLITAPLDKWRALHS
uniref:60S ribosomal protein L10-like n=1 Tax=Sus scrofa TaxID=9823 RepID=A0A8D0K4M1_PIG